MPTRLAIFGPETGRLNSYPDTRRAAMVIQELPVWWISEQWVVPPRLGHRGEALMAHDLRSPESLGHDTARPFNWYAGTAASKNGLAFLAEEALREGQGEIVFTPL